MNNELSLFYEKFQVDKYTLYESEYWIWSLRPVQATLGSGILTLKRHSSNLSDVTENEFSELASMIKVIERTMSKCFSYDVMNYLMLMMVDKHVHWHVIPRYETVRDIVGKEWVDLGWPATPILGSVKNSEQELNEIVSLIKSNLVLHEESK